MRQGNEPHDMHRRLGMPLVLAIIFVPLVFCWFTLRRGYSSNARIGAFA